MFDDDSQLLIETRRGREAAARALWHRHAARLVAYAAAVIRGVGTRSDAEDVVQSVFCRVMMVEAEETARVEDVGAWLAQLTRRGALNWIRGARRDRARVQRVADGARGAGPEAGDRTGHERMGAAVDGLPARLREVVVLRHVAGLTFDQIELATGVNRNTAAARYRVAIERLRAALGAGAAAGSGSIRSRMVQHA